MEEDTDSDEENGAAEIPHEMQLPHQQPQQWPLNTKKNWIKDKHNNYSNLESII
jgi:hypothetical protein